jgi:histidinol dehydrogenase
MRTSALRYTGRLSDCSAPERRALMERASDTTDTVRTDTSRIIARVRAAGDAALYELAHTLDGVELNTLDVPRSAWDEALDTLDTDVRRALERTVRNVRAAHTAFRPISTQVETEPGIVVGRRADPLARVGVYAPGGRAAYPSSVIMGVVPAKVAGVSEIVVCSPPAANGRPAAVVLAAAALAGADRVFAIGGAGAIAAMAYGTATVPRVDRIVGPGNAWVAEAKLQCVSAVAIDSPAGPSELLVIADATADAALVAREMLAQAEHDPDAAVVCVAIGDATASAIAAAVSQQIERAQRGDIIRRALGNAGGVLSASSLDEAIAFANEWAAEHLLLVIAEPDRRDAVGRLRSAGTICIGPASSVAFGDYMTGANHVLPTAGLARAYSGLSTADFVRWTSWQHVSPDAAASLARDVACLAESEGLPNHAAAARFWTTAA